MASLRTHNHRRRDYIPRRYRKSGRFYVFTALSRVGHGKTYKINLDNAVLIDSITKIGPFIGAVVFTDNCPTYIDFTENPSEQEQKSDTFTIGLQTGGVQAPAPNSDK